ncbi:hypothetical protein M407DRAFT_173124 [Tulasnella calospora MUT 4182]|uniref:Uncharacterized protein n=1 Tax=Tulasnella calospora MUT 4182 TaxID=1051891 RepID=A0A0C3L7C5_9AGAM|nr:hypothetical protein M407DRAFT_173124 [Tulasnella calospora MUT 4182]
MLECFDGATLTRCAVVQSLLPSDGQSTPNKRLAFKPQILEAIHATTRFHVCSLGPKSSYKLTCPTERI